MKQDMKQAMNHDRPNDETAELLRLMQEQGDDLSLARDIDFFLIFETRDEAVAFANQADIGPEFRLETSRYEKTSKWQARLTAHLKPVHAEIVMLEKQVARLGREYGGQPDGWGCAPAP
jgi:hypothetical protein